LPLLLCSLFLLAGCFHYREVTFIRQENSDPLPEGFSRRLEQLMEKGRKDTVQVYRYGRFCHLAPGDEPAARVNREAWRHLEKKEYREAAFLLREALSLDPDYGPACNNLGLLLEMEGRLEDSLDMYLRAWSTDPGNRFYRSNIRSATVDGNLVDIRFP
jgi:tetratricopeptide (TPR) repeat protein